MTRIEMYEDLLERNYKVTIAAAAESETIHSKAYSIYQQGLVAFSHPVSGVVARTWSPDKEKMVDDLFSRLYQETLTILSSPETTLDSARTLLCDALLTMGRFFNREEVNRKFPC